MKAICETCRYWSGDVGAVWRVCRALPPRPCRDDEGAANREWPVTHRDDWCGAHPSRIDPPPVILTLGPPDVSG